MNDSNLKHASGAQSVDDLEVAAGIGGGDNFGFGCTEVADFSLLEPGGCCRLRDVVDARTATTPRRLGAFAEFVTGKRT